MPSPIASRRFALLRPLPPACLIVLLLFPAPGAAPRAGESAPQWPPSVLLVTIDSLRPDHLGCYGYPRPTSPWIDRVAREGALFEQAYTQGGWTSPGMVSLLTGLYPSVHGVEARKDHFPCPAASSLSHWEKQGFQIPGWSTVDQESNYSRLGLQPDADYGFTPEQLTSWIHKHRSRPFLCWFHINKTPHLPYNPPEAVRNLFWPAGVPLARLTTSAGLAAVQAKVIIPKGTVSLTAEDKPALLALYDGELRMADDTVGKLYGFLEEEGLLESVILVIAADHGDELLDHGFIGHASTNWEGTLFDEILHVPLIIRYPRNVPSGKRVAEVVETIDLMPTLTELAGIPTSGFSQGTSLMPLISGRSENWPGIALSENSLCGYQCDQVPAKSRVRLASVRSARWKLIATHEDNRTRYALFDLHADPAETTDRLAAEPEAACRLKDLLLHADYRNRLARRDLLEICAGREK
jgi:arylsulfatase A-like enzyme